MRLIAILLSVLLLTTAAGAQSAEKDVLVLVDGHPIHGTDLAASAFLLGQTAKTLPPKRVRDLVLAELVDRKALALRAQRDGADRAIAAMVAETMADKAAPPPPDETAEERRRRIEYLTDVSLGERLLVADDRAHPITEPELRRRYDAMAAAKEVRLRLLVAPSRQLAEAARGRLLAGEDFASVAKSSSIDKDTAARGGDIGYVPEATLTPAYAPIVAAMRIGDLSQPVATDGAWGVIRLVDRRTVTIHGFDEMRTGLEREMRDERRRAFVASVRTRTPIEWRTDRPPGY